mgnify:CR=1 FL=1
MDHRLPATREMAQEFSELFVNRRAYTIQSMRPHPESGRHYYYRPKPRDGGEPVAVEVQRGAVPRLSRHSHPLSRTHGPRVCRAVGRRFPSW